MKIKPVETVSVPGYPDKYAEETKIALAAAHPRRWQSAPLVVGVLSATVALGLGGCEYATAGVPAPMPMPFEAGTNDSNNSKFVQIFVPLFEYGEGTGAIGCVSIAAPNFMSEEEAFAILSSALADAGLTLNRNADTLQSAFIPVTDLYSFRNEGKTEAKTKRGNLTTDILSGLNESLPVKFVSTNDLNNWQGKSGMMSTVSSYQIKETAQTLTNNNPGLVVFYDPVAMPDTKSLLALEQDENESSQDYRDRRYTAYAEAESKARIESKQLLREQVDAFIAWLQTEGIY